MTASKKQTVPVTERALIQRINRALAKDGQVLKKFRGDKERSNLGQFYSLDIQGNHVVRTDIDVEAFGRKLGALRPYEHLTE